MASPLTQSKEHEQWSCSACTLLNNARLNCCTLCGQPRTKRPPSGASSSLGHGAITASSSEPQVTRGSSAAQPSKTVKSKGRRTSATASKGAAGSSSAKKHGGSGASKSSGGGGYNRGATTAVAAAAAAKRRTVKVEEPQGWPRLLGAVPAMAYATRSGSGLVAAGDAVDVVYDPPVAGKQQDVLLSFTARGTRLGRLPREVARWLAPLVGAGLLEARGRCIFAPARLAPMEQVILSLDIYMRFAACCQPPGTAAVSLAPDEDAALSALAQAWLACFIAMEKIKPPDTAPAAGGADAGAGPATEDEGLEEEEGVRDLQYVCERIGKVDADLPEAEPGPRMRATLRYYQRQVGPRREIPGWAVEHCNTATSSRSRLLVLPNLLLNMLSALSQALAWMKDRETLCGGSNKTAKQLHPLWTAFEFVDGHPLYWNRLSGVVSIHFPSSSQQARGGILADAMVRVNSRKRIRLTVDIDQVPNLSILFNAALCIH